MNRWLVVTGLLAMAAAGTWAGTIQSHTWGFSPLEVDPNLLAALAGQTADPNAQIRVKGIEELGRLRAAKAWEVIAARLGDRTIVQTEAGEFPVAAVACAALGLLGEREAVPRLIPLLEARNCGRLPPGPCVCSRTV